MGRLIDLTGQKFGRLTVTGRAPRGKSNGAYWHCRCECGNTVKVAGIDLRRGFTQSCGCLRKETTTNRSTIHGWCNNRLYEMWRQVKRRCYNPKNIKYKDYGGRGISVCEEWRNSFETFRDWALANGYDETAPRGQCTLDRINVNGNYEPSNCRWANMKVQSNNTRKNRFITHNSETHTLAEWASITGLTREVISQRLALNWSVKKALTTPVKKYRLKTTK